MRTRLKTMEENLKEKKYLEKIQSLEEELRARDLENSSLKTISKEQQTEIAILTNENTKLKSLIEHKPETNTLGSQTEELEKLSPNSQNDHHRTASAGSSGSFLSSQAGFQVFLIMFFSKLNKKPSKSNNAIFDEMSINSQKTSTPKTSSLNIRTECDTPTKRRIRKTSSRRYGRSQMTAEQRQAEAQELDVSLNLGRLKEAMEKSRERSKSKSDSQLSDASNGCTPKRKRRVTIGRTEESQRQIAELRSPPKDPEKEVKLEDLYAQYAGTLEFIA